MNKQMIYDQQSFDGLPANRVVIPIIVALTILLAIIGALIAAVNKENNKLSVTLSNSAAYIEDVANFVAGANTLSDSSTIFVLRPLTEVGAVNTQPLLTYSFELAQERRGDWLMKKSLAYSLGKETMSKLDKLISISNELIDTQLLAISLVTAVHVPPNLVALEKINIPALSAEDEALSSEEKIEKAQHMMVFSTYTMNKHNLAKTGIDVSESIKEEMGAEIERTETYISGLRSALWAAMATITILIVAMFVILYRQIIYPLLDFVSLITTDHRLDEGEGLEEVRMLAAAYNGLLRRRDTLDGILRNAAETDALTNLSNRYGLEQCVLDVEEKGGSAALVLFDVNYLKKTNDNMGHAYGDMLLRDAAECIKKCFGKKGGNNCFRYGGDEFAAVIRDTSEQELVEMEKHFSQMQEEYGISVSCGWAFTENVRNMSCQALMEEADKAMYERKKQMHKDIGYVYKPRNMNPEGSEQTGEDKQVDTGHRQQASG
ncbi:MAG: GGDEF domain-containing protein [Lachnospiraceae bacterium]|nr:GGDEF domain-containing protein [Lachnospiraceae bacterium]